MSAIKLNNGTWFVNSRGCSSYTTDKDPMISDETDKLYTLPGPYRDTATKPPERPGKCMEPPERPGKCMEQFPKPQPKISKASRLASEVLEKINAFKVSGRSGSVDIKVLFTDGKVTGFGFKTKEGDF